MFDQGLLTVSAEYIVAAGDRLAAAGTTALNHPAVGAVVGEQIYRPAAPGLQPDAAALRSHRLKHVVKGGT